MSQTVCLGSINQFILRHSTEARATVQLCRIKEKCLKTDLKCVNGWSYFNVVGSKTYQYFRGNDSKHITGITRFKIIQGHLAYFRYQLKVCTVCSKHSKRIYLVTGSCSTVFLCVVYKLAYLLTYLLVHNANLHAILHHFKILWSISQICAINRGRLSPTHLFRVTPKLRIAKFGLQELETSFYGAVQNILIS